MERLQCKRTWGKMQEARKTTRSTWYLLSSEKLISRDVVWDDSQVNMISMKVVWFASIFLCLLIIKIYLVCTANYSLKSLWSEINFKLQHTHSEFQNYSCNVWCTIFCIMHSSDWPNQIEPNKNCRQASRYSTLVWFNCVLGFQILLAKSATKENKNQTGFKL